MKMMKTGIIFAFIGGATLMASQLDIIPFDWIRGILLIVGVNFMCESYK